MIDASDIGLEISDQWSVIGTRLTSGALLLYDCLLFVLGIMMLSRKGKQLNAP